MTASAALENSAKDLHCENDSNLKLVRVLTTGMFILIVKDP